MMKKPILLLILLLAASAFGQTRTQAPVIAAFIDVNVIPMYKERVVPHQTVIVRNGVIVEIGDAARIKIPTGAERIDGTGKFLILPESAPVKGSVSDIYLYNPKN